MGFGVKLIYFQFYLCNSLFYNLKSQPLWVCFIMCKTGILTILFL